jgi:hypothetical protein
MKKGLLIGGVLLALLAALYINMAVYPFFTSHPNYSDVERVFNKMQFPSDWTEIRSSENRGIAGRACPIESGSVCYHKSRSFNLPTTTTIEQVKSVMQQSGCQAISVSDNTAQGETKKKSLLGCSIDGMRLGADYSEGEYFSVTVYSS